MIRPGMLAHWVALSDDPLTAEPMRLREIGVLATAIGGRIVHSC
jgi:predicted amidohydrolase YtcJ